MHVGYLSDISAGISCSAISISLLPICAYRMFRTQKSLKPVEEDSLFSLESNFSFGEVSSSESESEYEPTTDYVRKLQHKPSRLRKIAWHTFVNGIFHFSVWLFNSGKKRPVKTSHNPQKTLSVDEKCFLRKASCDEQVHLKGHRVSLLFIWLDQTTAKWK